ncbi:MAG: acyl carrier protein [Syntrophomonadaceae bacterium]|nr:acyl carrier protein [Syntrophomonadaceae bacterium]
MENVFEKVKVIMAEHLNIDPQTITLDTTFQELEADSLDVVEMVMTLEDEFNIEIPDEQIENIKDKNVRQIVDYIYGALK